MHSFFSLPAALPFSAHYVKFHVLCLSTAFVFVCTVHYYRTCTFHLPPALFLLFHSSFLTCLCLFCCSACLYAGLSCCVLVRDTFSGTGLPHLPVGILSCIPTCPYYRSAFALPFSAFLPLFLFLRSVRWFCSRLHTLRLSFFYDFHINFLPAFFTFVASSRSPAGVSVSALVPLWNCISTFTTIWVDGFLRY